MHRTKHFEEAAGSQEGGKLSEAMTDSSETPPHDDPTTHVLLLPPTERPRPH